MRLRVFDLNTPWFWIVCFAQNTYGEPRIVLSFYGPQRWKRWWFHVWKHELIPEKRGGEVVPEGADPGVR